MIMNDPQISLQPYEGDAPLASSALNPLPIPPPPWRERGEQHRHEEWEASQKLLAAARALLRKYLVTQGAKPSLADIARMLELASKLGRLATGLATEKTEISGQDGGPLRVEFRAMLEKVYSQPLPGEIASPDPKALSAPAPAPSDDSPLNS